MAKLPATYSLEDNKLRVIYKSGVESVLFEDISSISFREVKEPRIALLLLCFVIGLVVIIQDFNNLLLGGIIMFLGFILMFVITNNYDNLIVETRGRKFIIFSVDHKQLNMKWKKLKVLKEIGKNQSNIFQLNILYN